MRKVLYIANLSIFALVSFVLVGAAFLLWTGNFSGGMYEIEDSVAVASPDDKYIATGYHILGSAVVHNSVIVQIRLANERHDVKKNEILFIVDDSSTSHAFNLSWANNKELVVTYTPGSVYIQKFNWNDVTLRYIQK